MIRHIVLFRVDARRTTEDEVAQVLAALAALGDRIPGLHGFEAGANCSPEGLSRGYTHVFTMDFTDAAARDAYLVHPAHQAAAEQLVAITEGGVEGILVIDLPSDPRN